MDKTINTPEENSCEDWIRFSTHHMQADPDEGFNPNGLDMVFETEHPKIDGKTDFENILVLSRTRVLSMDEYISSRAEDEAYSLFVKTH